MTLREAEDYLLGLELFGMRFGLDRMRRLMTALSVPAFDAIHVVGSNGKSSTTRMIAAILQRHGLRTGAYLSPHLVSFTERVRVDGADVTPEAFAGAVERVRAAAGKVDRTLGEDDRVTQFEALTAAAYSLLAATDVAVVEAGLGGRYDATNVLDTRVQVLTNVGLEHTRWLGPTIADIAAEKLAVVRPGGTLVVGAGLHPDALELARRTPAARVVVAPEDPGVEVLAQGSFQRRNFALARAAAEAYLGDLDEAAVRDAAASTAVPGRFEWVGEHTILDGAHNADGMRALAEALPRDRRIVAVLSILDDKDADAMLRALAPRCAEIVCTRCANPRALPPGTVQSLAQRVGVATRIEPDPRRALELARELAGPDGVALATGSLYLLADLKRPAGERRASTL